ncbi:restriction endonuclease subunit S [Treponema sp. OMZ 788]|uniref:restriction endonuclease subunit S n=1 Tax=Treponema sp. OMZ 788 TaxID=2563664 RepID=UPI0020A2888B|nr:restriction endonuclease subunit S [Treponema sp. OMZ 788]UTC64718.1 restriction endonuclease subunit S [Treponema sp. OMZ 788]
MNTNALRQKILDLAIHGKLVKQDPTDESAAILLEKIRAEKEKKIASGEIKRGKNDSYIFFGDDNRHYEKFADGRVKDIEDEIPFAVPEGWAWCRLGVVADIARGGSPRPIEDFITDKKNGINWIKIGDTVPESKYIISAKEKIKPEGKKHSRFVHAGDFLLTNSMSFGRPYILKIDGCIHDGWLVFADIIKYLLKDFLYYALSSKYIYNSFSLVAAGSTVKNLKADTVKQVLFPLPPLLEQKRITTNIEAIFAQIDLLEQNKADLQTAVKQAKSKILDLAIRGKLVPQDPDDEPASVMLEKLHAEKEAKIASGEIKRGKNDSYIYKNSTDNCYYQKYTDGGKENISDEIPFDVPEGWAWCRLPEVCRKPITDGTHNSPSNSASGDFLYITAKNIKNLDICLDDATYISKEIHESIYSRCSPELNDILLTKDGTIGEVAVNKLNYPFSMLSSVALIKPSNEILSWFLAYILISDLLQNKMKKDAKGSALKRIILAQINDFLIPLPPLAEQQRIVTKIEELFAQFDFITTTLTK